MYTLLIALLVSVLLPLLLSTWVKGIGWLIFIGILLFFLVMFIVNRTLGKKFFAIVSQVETIWKDSQGDLQKLVNRLQNKPGGSHKVVQYQIEKALETQVMRALEVLEQAKTFYPWLLLAERQVNALRVQLNFQIKRFDEVDKYLPKTFIMDPMTWAMKMTRQYHLNSPDLEKTFKKGIKKFKYEKGVLLYALYTWILVKRKDIDKALAILAEAKIKIEDENIHRNWQHLANNKPNLFSNAGFGDQWYGLHLEEPPKQRAGKGQMKNHPMMMRGKRRFF